MISTLKVATVLTFFIIASAYDLKYRRVPNTLWLVMLPIAIIYIYIDIILLKRNILVAALLAISISFVAVYVLYALARGMFGGADAKAVMVLALFYPSFAWGMPVAYLVLIFAAILALVYHFFILRAGFNPESKVPFLPFLTGGYILLMLLPFFI